MTLEEFASRFGVERQVLHLWIERRWIIASNGTLREVDVARARLIRDMQVDMGVNDEGVEIALHLIDQLHDLRKVALELHRQLDQK